MTSNSPPRAYSGWNKTHPYNTRFKRQFVANTATTSSATPDNIFSETTINALLATQDLTPIIDANSYHALQNLVTDNPSIVKDTLHYGEMQRDPDRLHFEAVMHREVSDLLTTDTVEVVPHSTVPPDNPPLPIIWSFHHKSRPDWTISKYRSRGHQIEGINYWDTYAPVVSWCTVRLTLILSLLSSLKSQQVDYVSAYTQAPLDCELFLNIPPGFIVQNNTLIFSGSSTKGVNQDWALKLKKNMYGLKQAGNNWFHCLKQSLIDRGFTQSSIDPCLFIRNNCIVIVYVDDCFLFAKSDDTLDTLIASLEKDFHLTSQGDVGAFLSIDIV